MSAKRLKQIAVVVVVLLGIWALGAVLLRPRRDDLGGAGVPTVSGQNVDTLTIATPGGPVIVLARGAEGWRVDGWKADDTKVDELLTQLRDTVGAELVAHSATSEARLGIDSASGYRLRARAGGRTLLDVVIGSRRGGSGSSYVRRAEDARAYLLPQDLLPAIGRGVEGWRDHTIVRVSTDSAESIRVRSGRDRYRLQRDSSGWRYSGAAQAAGAGEPADSAAVARLLETLSDVAAGGFATPAERDSARFGPRARRILVRGSHADTLADLALDSTAEGFLVQSRRDSVVYRISPALGRRLTPADSTVRK